MADDCFRLPNDVFVAILLLLPTSCRRRFRRVCKRWRDVIDEGTPERQVRSKILAFFCETGGSRAVVFDDDSGGRRRHAWTFPCSHGANNSVNMVATCSGLICLHEVCYGRGGFSGITVTNPVTGETAALPPTAAAGERGIFR
ncbi:hypothetical protein ACP4OV_017885 [Aristida adscensionis]